MQEDAVRSTDKLAPRNVAAPNNLGEQLFTLHQTITGLPHREAMVYFQENTVECLNTTLSRNEFRGDCGFPGQRSEEETKEENRISSTVIARIPEHRYFLCLINTSAVT